MPSDEERVAEAVNAWNDALSEGLGDETCARMTAGGQRAMVEPYKGIGPIDLPSRTPAKPRLPRS